MATRAELDTSINTLISKTTSADRITDIEHRAANKAILDYVDQEIEAVKDQISATGNTILNGTTNPTSGTGANGDFYINTATSTLFGPKASGAWPTGVSLKGPKGDDGDPGSGGGDVVVTVPFAEAVPFSNPTTFIDHEIAGPIEFTADLTDAQAGYGALVRLVSDGVNVPTFGTGIVVNENGDTHNGDDNIAYNYLFLYNGAEVTVTIMRVGAAVALTTPSAPTSGVVDDDADTFNWTNTSGYTSPSDYEYTLNGGTTYTTVTSKPIPVGDIAKNIGDVGVRVKAVPGVSNASLTLYNTVAFTVSGLDTPDAPTSGVVDDNADTFDWTNTPGYSALSDYEQTLNGGTSWTTVTAKPIAVGNVAKAAGQVGVRVKAVPGVSNASAPLYNGTAFNLTTPAAPTGPVTDDTANTFDWTNTTGFTDPTDYEYTLNGGTSWADVSAKPISVGNVSKAVGQVGVRVKEVVGVNNASSPLFNTVAYLITPAAPTGGTVDDNADTFAFTPTSGFAATAHEYSINGGTDWDDVPANPIPVGDVAIAAGDLQVRVKAVPGTNTASAALVSTDPFTLAPSGPTFVTWRNKAKMSEVANGIARDTAGTGFDAAAMTVENFGVGDSVEFKMALVAGDIYLGLDTSSGAFAGITAGAYITVSSPTGGTITKWVNGSGGGSFTGIGAFDPSDCTFKITRTASGADWFVKNTATSGAYASIGSTTPTSMAGTMYFGLTVDASNIGIGIEQVSKS